MKTSDSLSTWSSLMPLLILIGMAHFLVDTMLGIWPIYKSLAQLDMGKAGLIVAASAFVGEGSQLYFGTLSDKGYRKHLIIAGLLIAMASAFLAYSVNYLVLFGLYLFTCIGSGCFHPCAASLISNLIPARRGLLMTIFATGGSLGFATSQLTFTKAYALFDGQTYLLALPAVGLALFLMFYSFPQIKKNPEVHQTLIKDFRDFFKNPALKALYFSQIANQAILWGSIFILPDVLKELGHSDWICYGGGHFCFILGAACIMIPGGYLADVYSPKNILLYGAIISSITFYLVIFFGGISALILFPGLFILGASLASMNPIAVALGNRLEPLRSGAVSAFLMGLVWCISETLGPGGVGMMSSLFSDSPYASLKALAVVGSLFLVQIYATMCIPKKLFFENEPASMIQTSLINR